MLGLDLLVLVACGAGVVGLSIGLARAVDGLAEATGLGRLWLGSVLLATATSLPELATDISAVLIGAPDLAVGDLFGSSLTNLFLLGLLDVLRPRDGLLLRSSAAHRSSLALALGLTALGAGLVAAQPALAVGWMSPGSLALLGLYAIGVRRLAGAALGAGGPVPVPAPAAGERPIQRTARRAVAQFVLAAAGLLVLAPIFAASASTFAERSGLGTTFVGSWVVALATSLPEVVTCLTAVRMGAPDLAIGNLLGSNAFNMIIFAPLDALQPGSFFVGLDRAHLVVAGSAMVMTGMVGWMLHRGGRRIRGVPPGAWLVAMYVLCLVALRLMTAGEHGAGRA